jgi:DNA-binding LytR/AlgR family response regulator
MSNVVLVRDEQLVVQWVRTLTATYPEVAKMVDEQGIGRERRPHEPSLSALGTVPRISKRQATRLAWKGTAIIFIGALATDSSLLCMNADDGAAVRLLEAGDVIRAVERELEGMRPSQDAIDRLTHQRRRKDHCAKSPYNYDCYLFSPSSRSGFVAIESIACVKAFDSITLLLTTDGDRFESRRPLRAWEAVLPVSHFVRIHRSAVVNRSYVERIEPSNCGGKVFLRGVDEPLSLSRRYAVRLRRARL